MTDKSVRPTCDWADRIQKMICQVVNLFTKLGDSCRFPKAAFADGSDREKRLRHNSVATDQRSVGRNIQTEKEGIRPSKTRGQKIRDQRIVHAAAVAFRPGAVNDSIDGQRIGFVASAIAVGHSHSVIFFLIVRDPAGVHLNLAAGNLLCDRLGDLRRGAMAVDFPVRTHMSQKASSLWL